MKIKNKLFIFVLTFAMILSLIPTVNVHAATKDVKIISDTEVTAKEARKWAKSKGATETFIDLADLYFDYSEDHGNVNPAIAYVQAAKETGYGKFGGVIDESYHNPCGLKTAEGGGNYDPNAHQKFNDWDEGVQAHLDHLALYAGAKGYPRSDSYDPRHFRTIKGKATTVNALGGNWAPSATYGEEVNALYKDLLNYAGVEDEDSADNDNDEDSNSSNATPNPGTPENKPSAPSVADVIAVTKPGKVDDAEASKPNITSTIGWKKENGDWYYYKSDNTKAVGWIKPDSNWYYLKDDGKMATDWVNVNGTWYYLNVNSGIMTKGWVKLNNSWYYLKDSGAMATGFEHDGSNLYYFKDSGIMATNSGWIKLNGKWYYSEPSGVIKTGWLKENGAWYYLQGDGSMVTGLNRIDGKIYSFSDSGSMKTGWAKINNYWYYFNGDGSLATGWITDGGSNYYLYDTGAMAKGWINLNGTWYLLKDSGAMAKGWVTSGSDSYYLEPSTGRLLTNTTIDGYKIGSDGKKQTSSSSNNNSNNSSNNNNSNSNTNVPSGKKVIVVDAGHNYGGDDGAYATNNGVQYVERDLNMQVASKLQAELEKRGYTVIMTRTENDKDNLGETQSLTNRVNIANNYNADFFVSIHHNSATPAAKGIETYYSSTVQDSKFGGNADSNKLSVSKNMATLINNRIASKLNLNNRGAKDSSLFVCRNTNMASILVEVGFITNPEEAARCADPSSQQKVAESIAEVISENF